MHYNRVPNQITWIILDYLEVMKKNPKKASHSFYVRMMHLLICCCFQFFFVQKEYHNLTPAANIFVNVFKTKGLLRKNIR